MLCVAPLVTRPGCCGAVATPARSGLPKSGAPSPASRNARSEGGSRRATTSLAPGRAIGHAPFDGRIPQALTQGPWGRGPWPRRLSRVASTRAVVARLPQGAGEHQATSARRPGAVMGPGSARGTTAGVIPPLARPSGRPRAINTWRDWIGGHPTRRPWPMARLRKPGSTVPQAGQGHSSSAVPATTSSCRFAARAAVPQRSNP